MLDEVARWDDLVTGLRPVTYGTKGEPARCLVSVGPTITAKASSEGWRLSLRPNKGLLLGPCFIAEGPAERKQLRLKLLERNAEGTIHGASVLHHVRRWGIEPT
jgi:hypothetical protein